MQWFAKFDTLFVRLFLLMWATLVMSHAVAFLSVRSADPPPRSTPHTHNVPPAPPPSSSPMPHFPTFPSLPPHELPFPMLSLDYAIRMLVMAAGAWLGARWLATPMRRLAQAAHTLSQGLGASTQPLTPLDEQQGTVEVRETAQVFNHMARQLSQQFDADRLHMAAVSHDLRTPLTRLRMRLAMVHWSDEEQQTAAAADIHAMDELIGSTLAVLREQSEGSPARAVDVNTLLQAIVDDWAEQNADIAFTPSTQPLCVRGHPVALRRIVDNLVHNALRHGNDAVSVSAVRVDEQRVHILVEDNGSGIDPRYLEDVFIPWVGSSSGSGMGFGLGLAIARDLAQRDGGHVTLRNREEGGLCACVDLLAAA